MIDWVVSTMNSRERLLGESQRPLQLAERLAEDHYLLARRDLGQRDHEVVGQLAAGLAHHRRHEQVQRAQAARRQLLAERLDADADERRQRPGRHSLHHLERRRAGVAVLLLVGAVPVAVLEVDPEVLDRLALQLGANPLVDRPRQVPDRVDAGDRGELERVGAVLVHGPQRDCAQLRRRVRLEQVSPAVHRVDRLTASGLERVALHDQLVRPAQPPEQLRQRRLRQGRVGILWAHGGAENATGLRERQP
jgi:hypothetical protein